MCDQISGTGGIIYKKMFGDYGIYCDGKIIGLICENQFFVKKTIVGAELLSSAEEAPPYANAKPHFVIECLENREFLADFIRKTCDELPATKPRKKKTAQ
ncbi:MAG: TfoX/Sxy family protein [Desulfitobacteriaceae bacterium]